MGRGIVLIKNYMGDKELRLIEANVQVKLNIAEIYSIFSRAVPKDYIFWSELAREKSNDVALVKSGTSSFIMSSQAFPPQIFQTDIQVLENIKNWLYSLLAKYTIEPPDRAAAFETALLIEKSVADISSTSGAGDPSSESMYIFERPGRNYNSTLEWLRSYIRKAKILNEIPAIVGERVLIIKDEVGVAELLQDIMKQLMSAEKHFDTVKSGREGLDMIIKKYYKLIISDIEMPGMDGIELYSQASRLFPNINKRFLFVTADPSPDRLSFFQEYSLEYMSLPASIMEIREKAQKLLLH